ncbi:protocadherin Fat 4-like isoform X2 [Athalia rosae]|uniref:protocadherin Fat 4-like isoform X2 n=1 Tax=Athalia rosae TaxID=37344 RepID=UPI00203455AC|nr:protocadherin Fat 4-like isoform X2 [Athalia rosae]
MAAEVHLGLLISLTFFFGSTTAEWGTPPFLAPDIVDEALEFIGYNDFQDQTNIRLKEEVTYNVTIAQFNYVGTDTPVLGTFDDNKSNLFLGAVIEKDLSGVWQLVVTKTQDYEVDAMQSYRFRVAAGGETRRIALNVVNVDDNAPVIQADSQSCSVEENWSGRTKCSFRISDADGDIDRVTFEIIASPTSGTGSFSMAKEYLSWTTREMIGYLQVDKNFDYETITMYLLQIVAEDGEGNRGNTSYVVQVIDRPDEPPVWTNMFSATNIFEKSTNHFEVSAIDGDFGINAEISYEIIASEGEEDYFEVNSKTGEITINPIDRDTLAKEVFRFLIVAYETLDTSERINSTVVIIVEDTNDHKPEISPDELSIEIAEETFVTLEFNRSIAITDPDLAENAQFTVELTDDSEFDWSSAFLVIPNSGYQLGTFIITVINASLLDYEDANWRNMKIQMIATEVANNSHIGTRDITINLVNRNDEMPIFESPLVTVAIPEDVPKDEYIATMLATDRDIDDEVKHALVSQRTLTMNADTGVIRTAQDGALDYETIPIVVVQITATDHANHVTYATLMINVIDVNDVPPMLSMPRFQPRIDEEGDIGEEINATISATDVDTASEIVFSIDWDSSYAYKSGVTVDEEAYRGHLEILTTYPEGHTRYAEGKLVVAGRLDYEQFDDLYLSIVVTDTKTVHNDNSTSALLTLVILDINDNKPIFEQYTAMSVTENQISDTLIGNVLALDADGPGNNVVTYTIAPRNGTASGLVKINSLTGVITVDSDKAIDAEVYEFLYYTVDASDGVHNTYLELEIFVIDQNDVVPNLLSDEYDTTLYLREKSPSGTWIVTVKAEDNDRTSPFNNVSYLLNSDYGQLFSYFSMGKYSGDLEISLSDGYILDRDYGTPVFTVYLTLRDNFLDDGVTWNTNSITASVTVILTDINDQIPELPELSDPAATVSESTIMDTLVLTVTAVDHDQPGTNNTRVFYEIRSVTRTDKTAVFNDDCPIPFKVETQDDSDALIYANCDLKGYYGTWAIELYAQDLGTDPSSQNDTRIYNIFVEDYNYYNPVITYPVNGRSIRLSRNQTLNSQLFTHDHSRLNDFTATDGDSGPSGTVTFELIGSETALEYFTLIATGTGTAQLQLIRLPSNWDEYTFDIEIFVTDHGMPNRTTTQRNTVFFISTNGPEFSENQWTAWFSETSIGLQTSVIIPEASDMVNVDVDEADKVKIYYFFTSEEGDMSYFTLDKETRELTLIKELDREAQELLTLYVVATTNSETIPENPREKATLAITIIVVDVNDNPPSFESTTYFGGITPEDVLSRVILTVVATDADFNETLSYTIEEGSMNYTDSSLSSISTPFEMDRGTGDLLLRFNPLSTMTGYFDFTVLVHDAVNHSDSTNVKVYIVAQSNRVAFTFRNTITEVSSQTAFVISSFTEAFGYICNIDYVTRSLAEDEITSLDNETIVTTHFIDQSTNLPINSDVIVLASNNVQTITNLKVTLLTRSLNLIDVPSDTSQTVSNIQEIIQSVLIALCVLLLVCCIALATAYVIKTRRLTARLDKLAVTKFGSQSSGLNRIGVVPTSNKFAIEGSNPMWNTDEKIYDETISYDAGDEDLPQERRGSLNPVMANQLEARRDSRNPMALPKQKKEVPTTDL